ncbi:MAG: hypothetical protein Q3986_09635 [Akkermansia sp.]|nr:hypothetical protein [Akkermansia sp.]
MKRTLTLLTLMGAIAAAPLNAREVWWKGVTRDPETQMMEGAITSYKHNPYAGEDSEMCWVAAASNVIAWWQDRVEENGALIIPEEAPRGYNVFEKERTLWANVGGYEGTAIQMWMTGAEKLLLSPYPGYDATAEGLKFTGYYPRLAGASLNSANYRNSYGINPETAARFSIYPHYKYTMIQTQWYQNSNYSYFEPELDNYQRASKQIVDYMENDWGVVWATTIHAMTVYGVEVDENGLLTTFFNSDNNNQNMPYGKYYEVTIKRTENPDGSANVATSWAGYKLNTIVAVRTTGIRFLDYDVRVGKNIVGEDEFLFSHYCNLIVDGADNYKLQYDLRDARAEGSPVDAKKVNLVTYDDGLSYEEQYTDEEVPTGHMHLQGGQVTLVDCDAERKNLDGGGRIEGTISFENSKVAGTDRTLKVDRTDTIAKEISLSATSGSNTLEVTDGNTAKFGTLSGTGDLDKTGAGTAEVTGALTLQGDIRVHEGSFVFGKDATISGAVSLTVTGGGVMKGSGTFVGVTVDDGGTLIVGNSPGRQKYLGDLSVNLGEIVFGVSGWNTAADDDNVGWGSGTYSNVVMNGNSLTLGEGCQIRFGVADDALAALLSGNGGSFSMTIATGIGNGDYFKSDLLSQLADQTIFYVADEAGAAIANDAGLKAGDTLETYISDLQYNLVDNTQLCVTGVFWAAEPMVPEPATATLSLLALASLAARRRRR